MNINQLILHKRANTLAYIKIIHQTEYDLFYKIAYFNGITKWVYADEIVQAPAYAQEFIILG